MSSKHILVWILVFLTMGFIGGTGVGYQFKATQENNRIVFDGYFIIYDYVLYKKVAKDE